MSLKLDGWIDPIDPKNVDLVGEFFSAYAQGRNATVECRGQSDGSEPKWKQGLLDTLTIVMNVSTAPMQVTTWVFHHQRYNTCPALIQALCLIFM